MVLYCYFDYYSLRFCSHCVVYPLIKCIMKCNFPLLGLLCVCVCVLCYVIIPMTLVIRGMLSLVSLVVKCYDDFSPLLEVDTYYQVHGSTCTRRQ